MMGWSSYHNANATRSKKEDKYANYEMFGQDDVLLQVVSEDGDRQRQLLKSWQHANLINQTIIKINYAKRNNCCCLSVYC